MSKLDRKLAKRNAELRNRVGILRDMRDDPALREKTPNVRRFMHRPRPTTAPDRKDLQSAGSNFAPDDELDLEDYDVMNGAAIPNMVHVDPPTSARPMTGMPHRSSLSTRGSILLTNRGLQSPDGDYGEVLLFSCLLGCTDFAPSRDALIALPFGSYASAESDLVNAESNGIPNGHGRPRNHGGKLSPRHL